MAVDNTIRFNSHNSYKVTSQVFCYPFGVEGQTHVTHSFQAYCTSMLSSATRAKTRFFNTDGLVVGESSHAFAVTTVFGVVEITVAVPATAVQAQLMFIQGGTDWWFAEPKSEYGESATPYTVNYTNQLTYITPTGIYTGMVTTGQIVVAGTVSNPDETLDTRLVTINSNAINLSSTVSGLSSSVGDQETRITTIEAGQITLTSTVNGISPKVTKITSAGIYTGTIAASQITTGYLSADRIQAKTLTGAKLADGTVQALQIAAGTITATQIASSTITGNKIASGTITANKIDVSDLFAQNVTATGTITGLKLSAPVITGGSLNIGSGKFTVDSSGNLTATSATIKGTLQAGSIINGSLNSTTGRHNGTIYSASGELAVIPFSQSAGRLYYDGNIGLSGSLYHAGIVTTNYSGTGNGMACPNSRMLAQGYDTSSDERLKQDIRPALSELVEDIYNLPIIEFSYKTKPDKTEIGINATEVVNTMPARFTDIVIGSNDGYFNANYTGINIMAILAIQDLNKRVSVLEAHDER